MKLVDYTNGKAGLCFDDLLPGDVFKTNDSGLSTAFFMKLDTSGHKLGEANCVNLCTNSLERMNGDMAVVDFYAKLEISNSAEELFCDEAVL